MVLSLGLHVQAQAQTFNKRFDLFGEMEANTAWSVEVLPDGSALVIFNGPYSTQDSIFGSALCTVVVDPDGQFSNGFRLHVPGRNSFPGWTNSSVPSDTVGYYCFGSTSADTSRLAIYWLNNTGSVTHYHEIILPLGSWIARGGTQAPDGGFLLVGEYYPGPGFDALLVKTDAQGNLEWYRTYGSPGLYESLTSIVPAPWGGYYIGGSRETSTWVWEPWIVRVDELGNVIGEGDYGSSFHEEPAAQLTLSDNGNVLVAGAMSLGTGIMDGRAMLYEVDQDGEIVWQKLYGPVTRAALFVVHQVPGSTDLIAAGFDDRTEIVEPLMGTLLRTTATGDSIWMRSYAYHDSLVELGNAGFYDMQPTPDGGFIAVGFAEANWQQGPSGWEQVYSRDVWVVKTDSMGCLEPGCHLIMGMETQITNLRGALNVAPNPVVSGGNVQMQLQLPGGFTVQGALRITVTDEAGRLVQEQPMPSGVSAFSFQLSAFPAGLYHLHLHDDSRWIAGAKLVVE